MKYLFHTFLAFAAFSQPAFALTKLKNVQVTAGGKEIHLLFDEKVKSEQIKTEFFGDIVQVLISDAGIYPAKVMSVSGGDITKVFAYQYSPKVVRCRLSVKGQAEAFTKRVKINVRGKVAEISILPDAAAEIARDNEKEAAAQTLAQSKIEKKVMGEAEPSKPIEKIEGAAKTATIEKTAEAKTETTENTSKLVSGDKHGVAKNGYLTRWLTIVGFLLGCLGFSVFVIRKGSIAQKLKQFAGKKLGQDKNAIEVLSTQYLGPKKSIAVVRAGGKTLVLGVTEDSINLISQVNSPSEADDSLESATAHNESDTKSGSFENAFEQMMAPVPVARSGERVRERVKARLGDLRPL